MKKIRDNLVPYLFIAPYLLIFFGFFLVPIFYAFYLSLHAERGLERVFVGFDNYFTLIGDSYFHESLINVGLLLFLQFVFIIGSALLFALLLDLPIVKKKLKSFFRLSFFLPYAVPSAIVALMWGFILSPSIGPFVPILEGVGITDFDFFDYIIPVVTNMLVWKWAGYNMIILYTGLTSISPELYEAARIDGASQFQIAWHIKIPLLKPMLIFASVMTIIGGLQVFNEPAVLDDITYVPNNLTPNYYIYDIAFNRGAFTHAAAAAVILAVIIGVLAFGFLKVTGGAGEDL